MYLFILIGKTCSIDVDECNSNPCLNGATCIDNVASFTCSCPIGLTGKLCEININDCEVSIYFILIYYEIKFEIFWLIIEYIYVCVCVIIVISMSKHGLMY